MQNLSSQSFDKVEINVLNKDLNFGVPDTPKNLDEVIAYVEIAILYMPESSKGLIIEIIKNNISKKIINDKELNKLKPVNTQIIKRLPERMYLPKGG